LNDSLFELARGNCLEVGCGNLVIKNKILSKQKNKVTLIFIKK